MSRIKSRLLVFLSIAALTIWGHAVPGWAQMGAVTKSDGGATPVAGDPFTYTVTIPNVGTTPLTNVVFSDFPDPITVLVNGSVTTTQGTVVSGNGVGQTNILINVGTISPGVTVVITFEVVPCKCIGYPMMVHNQGFVISDQDSTPTNPTETPVEPKGMPLLEATKECVLHQDSDGSGQLSPGDTLRYVIHVPNTGLVAVPGAVFTDNLGPNTQLVTGSVTTTHGTVLSGNASGNTNIVVSLGTLPLGASATITFDVLITGTPTQVSNQGFVTYNGGTAATDNPATAPVGDATVCQVFPTATPDVDSFKAASLLIDADGSGLASPGDTLQYTIQIVNNGTAPQPAVTFNDTPDARTKLVTGTVTTSQGTVVLGNSPPHQSVQVNVGTLNAGQTVTIRFNVTINEGATGTLANQGIVTTPTGPTPTDNPNTPPPDDKTETPVGPKETPELGVPAKVASLALDADGNGTPSVGDTLLYTIKIPNVGKALIHDVSFSDTLDPNTALVVGTVTTSQGTVVIGNGAGHTRVQVDIGDLAIGQTVTIAFRATIGPGASGVISNQGIVTTPTGPTPTDNPNTPPPTDATETPVSPKGPPLRPTKTVEVSFDADRNGVASTGDTLRYTIQIPNISVKAIPDVVFSDTIESGLTLLSGKTATSKGAVTAGATGGSTLRVEVGTINPGETVTITFEARINPGTTAVRNQAIVDTPTGPTPTDNPNTPTPNDSTDIGVKPTPEATCDTGKIWRVSSTSMLVQLSATSFDATGEIVKWVWDFGDGTTCSNDNPEGCSARFGDQVEAGTVLRPVHLFNGIGRFVVKLTFTDTQGNVGTDACSFTFGDPPVMSALDVNANQFLDDAEILTAIDYWISGRPVPGTNGQAINDKMIRSMIDLWIRGQSIAPVK